MEVLDQACFKLATHGCAVRHTSVPRHVTDCATWPHKKTGHEIRLLNNSFYIKDKISIAEEKFSSLPESVEEGELL